MPPAASEAFAVQLAIADGAGVIGTGRPKNQTFIAQLGAIPSLTGKGWPTESAPSTSTGSTSR